MIEVGLGEGFGHFFGDLGGVMDTMEDGRTNRVLGTG